MQKKLFKIFFLICAINFSSTTYSANTNICSDPNDQILKNIKSIKVEVEDYRKWSLNSIRIITGNFRWVPERFKKRYKSKIFVIFDDNSKCSLKGLIRHNGNQKDHIQLVDNSNSIIQSLDVNLINGNINGIKKFKLLLNHTRGVLNDEIFLTTLLRHFNYLAPRTMLVDVNLNNSKTKMIFQEKSAYEMLKHNNRLDGPIFRGDERFFFHLVESLPDNNLSNEAQGMLPLLDKGAKIILAKSHNEEIIKKNNSYNEMTFNSLSNLNLIYLFYSSMFQNEYNKFKYSDYTLSNELLAFNQKENILKLDKYNLILNSANALHALGVNNRKFYWNNTDQFFEPINYDNNANFENKPIHLIMPISKHYKDAIVNLENELKTIDIDKLGERLQEMGLNQSSKVTKKKINLLIRNLQILKNKFENYNPVVLQKNYKNDLSTSLLEQYFQNLKDINLNIKLVKRNNGAFEVCAINISCKVENFEQKDLMSLLSGNLKIEGLDYQFLGNKFENNSLIK